MSDAVGDIEESLAKRQELSDSALRQIEQEIAEAVTMLRQLGEPWRHGAKLEFEFLRLSIDKAIASRKKERRAELVRSWRDRMAIRERLLELRRELIALRG